MEINKTELLRVFDFRWENPKHEQVLFVIKIYRETKSSSEEPSNPESKETNKINYEYFGKAVIQVDDIRLNLKKPKRYPIRIG